MKIFQRNAKKLAYGYVCCHIWNTSSDSCSTCYHEFSQIKVLGELYTSFKCRSERSTAVIAAWLCVTGEVLTRKKPTMEDLRIGEVQYISLCIPQQ